MDDRQMEKEGESIVGSRLSRRLLVHMRSSAVPRVLKHYLLGF